MSRTLAEAAAEAASCTKCRLAQGRTQVVFGVGDPNADLMFIGEGPGFHEDKQGEPFVGAAGQLLTRMLGEIGLTREEVYIANIVMCRPPGNRDPQPDEIEACTPWLVEQISLIQPKVIVTLGNFATKFVLDTHGGHHPAARSACTTGTTAPSSPRSTRPRSCTAAGRTPASSSSCRTTSGSCGRRWTSGRARRAGPAAARRGAGATRRPVAHDERRRGDDQLELF